MTRSTSRGNTRTAGKRGKGTGTNAGRIMAIRGQRVTKEQLVQSEHLKDKIQSALSEESDEEKQDDSSEELQVIQEKDKEKEHRKESPKDDNDDDETDSEEDDETSPHTGKMARVLEMTNNEETYKNYEDIKKELETVKKQLKKEKKANEKINRSKNSKPMSSMEQNYFRNYVGTKVFPRVKFVNSKSYQAYPWILQDGFQQLGITDEKVMEEKTLAATSLVGCKLSQCRNYTNQQLKVQYKGKWNKLRMLALAMQKTNFDFLGISCALRGERGRSKEVGASTGSVPVGRVCRCR